MRIKLVLLQHSVACLCRWRRCRRRRRCYLSTAMRTSSESSSNIGMECDKAINMTINNNNVSSIRHSIRQQRQPLQNIDSFYSCDDWLNPINFVISFLSLTQSLSLCLYVSAFSLLFSFNSYSFRLVIWLYFIVGGGWRWYLSWLLPWLCHERRKEWKYAISL